MTQEVKTVAREIDVCLHTLQERAGELANDESISSICDTGRSIVTKLEQVQRQERIPQEVICLAKASGTICDNLKNLVIAVSRNDASIESHKEITNRQVAHLYDRLCDALDTTQASPPPLPKAEAILVVQAWFSTDPEPVTVIARPVDAGQIISANAANRGLSACGIPGSSALRRTSSQTLFSNPHRQQLPGSASNRRRPGFGDFVRDIVVSVAGGSSARRRS